MLKHIIDPEVEEYESGRRLVLIRKAGGFGSANPP